VLRRDTGKIKALWKRFSDKEYRDAFFSSRLRSSVAAQIYFIRESRKWTQSELAEKAGTGQPAISRIERGSASLSVRSLEAIAKAFDVGLCIRFIPHSEIAEDAVFGRLEAYVPPFADDIPDAPGVPPLAPALPPMRYKNSGFVEPTPSASAASENRPQIVFNA
jgi:transcriptional regulator with XRE-family HTH domain